MPTEENVKDILEMYNQGYSLREIFDEYEGLDPRIIADICEGVILDTI